MINNLISYLNSYIGQLWPELELKGLAELHTVEGSVVPAIYCEGGYQAVNLEDGKGIVYFRLTGDIITVKTEDETSVSELEERTYPLRLVAFIPKSFLDNDRFSDKKLAENALKLLKRANGRALRATLKADEASFEQFRANTERKKVYEQEFQNVENEDAHYDYALIAIDFDAVVTGTPSCFLYNICGDETSQFPNPNLCPEPEPCPECPDIVTQAGASSSGQIVTAVTVNNKTYGVTEGLVVHLTAAQMKAILVDTGIAAPVIGQFTNGELEGFGVYFPTLSDRIAENTNAAVAEEINDQARSVAIAEQLIDNHLLHQDVINIIDDNAGLTASVRSYYGTKDDYLISLEAGAERNYVYAHVTQRNAVISGVTILSGHGNFSSYSLEINGIVQTSSPVKRGDRMRLTFHDWNGQPVEAVINGSISDSTDYAKSINITQGDGRYLFCHNVGNSINTYSKVDLQTGLITNSGVIGGLGIFFNNKSGFLYAGNIYNLYEIDPVTMAVVRTISDNSLHAGWGAAYDPKRDLFWLNHTTNLCTWDPETETVQYKTPLIFRNGLVYLAPMDMLYAGTTGTTAFHLCDTPAWSFAGGGTNTRSVVWVEEQKRLYASAQNSVLIFSAGNGFFELETSVNAIGLNRGTIFYHAPTGYIFSSSFNTGSIGWLNTANNATGALAISYLGTETHVYDMAYSSFTDRYYLRPRNSERMLVFDPNTRSWDTPIIGLPASGNASENFPYAQVITNEMYVNG